MPTFVGSVAYFDDSSEKFKTNCQYSPSIEEEGRIAASPAHRTTMKYAMTDRSGHDDKLPQVTMSGHSMILLDGEVSNTSSLFRYLPPETQKILCENTTCEARIVAELIESCGTEIICKMQGGYAIAFWSDTDRELTLACDRIGIKRIFYSTSSGVGQVSIFSSSMSALMQFDCMPVVARTNSLETYVFSRTIPGSMSACENIRKLLPGQVRKQNKDKVVTVNRGNLFTACRRKSGENVNDKRLSDIIVSDVDNYITSHRKETGILFSGGIDSTLVAAAASRIDKSVELYTVSLTREETVRVTELADYLNMPLVVLEPSIEELQNEAQNILDENDEINADGSLIVTRLAARIASQNSSHVLTGDGADELFYGYRFYEFLELRSTLMSLSRNGDDNDAQRSLLNDIREKVTSEYVPMLSTCILTPPNLAFTQCHAGASQETIRKLVRKNDLYWEPNVIAAVDDMQTELEVARGGIIQQFLIDLVLPKVDIAAEKYGISMHSPFLTEELVQFGMNINPKTERVGGKGKQTLRRILASEYGLDFDKVQKQGFRSPLSQILNGPLRSKVMRALDVENERYAFWDQTVLNSILREHYSDSSSSDWSQLIWTLLTFKCWLDKMSTRRT